MKRKLLFLVLALLLISVGLAAAQSSANYVMERFVMISGGSANSANYQVDAVIGQPATGVVVSSNHKVSSGFLYPDANYEVWLPLILK